MSTLLDRRRVMMVGNTQTFHELPSGYTALEYLENPNGACIDTGITIADVDFIDITFAIVERTAKNESRIFGGTNWTAIGGYHSLMLNETKGNGRVILYNNVTPIKRYFPTETGTPTNIIFELEPVSAYKAYQDGVLAFPNLNFTNTIILFYGSGITNGGLSVANVQKYGWAGRMYDFKIGEHGTLSRWFVPCINTDGEFGMWEKVNGEFYGSENEAVFTGQ